MKISSQNGNAYGSTIKSTAPGPLVVRRPNSSPLSQGLNSNKPKADGGMIPSPSKTPSIGKPITKPNFHGKPVK